MSFGQYLRELEEVAEEFNCEFSNTSLAVILTRFDMKKLSDFSMNDRALFYETLIKQIRPSVRRNARAPRHKFFESDAKKGVAGVEEFAKKNKDNSKFKRLLDVICAVFPAGCPFLKEETSQ